MRKCIEKSNIDVILSQSKYKGFHSKMNFYISLYILRYLICGMVPVCVCERSCSLCMYIYELYMYVCM